MAEAGDVVLLRSFAVQSRNREPMLTSADESAWCVWRYGKPCWGSKKGKWGELREREEVLGPQLERGEGEWTEVEKLRGWWLATVKENLERERAKGEVKRKTRTKGSVDVQIEEVERDE